MKKSFQKEIISNIGIAQSTLSNIVNGRRRPSWDIAKKLAIVTNTSPDIWMDGQVDVLRKIISTTPQERSDNG